MGDIKQSIYRWRNGDWKILKDIGNEAGLNRPEIRSLTTNYRSERRIIGFNNALFENAAKEIDMIAPDADIKIADAYHDVKQSCPDNKPDKGYVRIRFYNEKDKDTDPEELMLDELCEQAGLLHKAGTAYEDMAILVRKRKHTAPIVRKFAQKLPDVKLVSDEAFLLSNSHERQHARERHAPSHQSRRPHRYGFPDSEPHGRTARTTMCGRTDRRYFRNTTAR